MGQTKRPGVHSYLSQDAYDALHAFAEGNGISVTSIVETTGMQLAEEMEAEGTTDVRREFVRRCRKLDAGRRRR